MRRIAFVCTGNICRSPMAEYLLRALAPHDWHLEISSYGIMTTDGKEASSNATVAAMEEGIDLSPHRSRALRPNELRECDLVLTMTNVHKSHILVAMPDLADRIFCLAEFGRAGKKSRDIKDPIGGDLVVYRKCLGQMRGEIERIIPVIDNYFGLG